MRTILSVITTWVLVGGMALQAAGKEPPAPTIEVRIKAVNDFLPVVEYVGELAGQEEQAKQLTAVVKVFAGAKGLEGIDVKKPMGVYAALTPTMIDSPIVLMLPIANQEAFLNLLSNRLSLKPTKGDDDIYSMSLPNVAFKAYFCFHKGYVFGSLYNRAALEKDSLIDPAKFLDSKDPALVSITTYIDRLPLEVRKSFLGQLELKLADSKKSYDPKSRSQLAGYTFASDLGFEGIRTTLEEANKINMRIVVDPKKDELQFDVQLTAKDGSDLKSCLNSASRRRSSTMQAVAARNPIFSFSSNFEMGDSTRKLWEKTIESIFEEAIEQSPEAGRDLAEKVYKSLRPTLVSGTVDLAFALTGQPGDYAVTSAIRMKDGQELEKVIKEFAPLIPVNALTLQTDAARVGKTNLHSLQVHAPEVKTYFGTDTFWLGTGQELLALSSGEKKDPIESLVNAKAERSEIFRAEVSLVRVAELVEKEVKREDIEKLADSIFEKVGVAGNDTAVVHVSTGDALTIRVTVKGKGVKFLALLDQKKKSQ